MRILRSQNPPERSRILTGPAGLVVISRILLPPQSSATATSGGECYQDFPERSVPSLPHSYKYEQTRRAYTRTPTSLRESHEMMGPGGGDPAGPSAAGPVSADVEMGVECCSGGEAAAATGEGPPMAHLGGDHHLPQQQGYVDGQGGKDWGMLALARQLAHEGKPSLALQAVVMAVKTEGGEHAVVQVLHRARELYRSKVQANAAAEELASLFAQCAIAEANPAGAEPLVPAAGNATMLPGIDENSILAESGRKQIVLDAFSDGSSFICLQCGGLVSSLRKQEHVAYWCPGQM